VAWLWLRNILKKLRGSKGARPKVWPTAEDQERLSPFEELLPEHIYVIETSAGAQRAYDELSQEPSVGFDTESKPTFRKGEISTGPHLVQFATTKRAYLFLLHEPECRKLSAKLIQSPTLKKVGFGLADDVKRIRTKLHVQPRAVLDLETMFVAKGYGRGVGVKVGVAIALKRRFHKSKKASTSNWASRRLSDNQIIYAANDAYAAIKVFNALTK
jgi:ribonuclease D